MNANKVHEKVFEILTFEYATKKELNRKIRELKEEFKTITSNGDRYKQGLLKTLKKKIDSYFNKDNTCECQHIYPDQIELRTHGVFCFF